MDFKTSVKKKHNPPLGEYRRPEQAKNSKNGMLMNDIVKKETQNRN